MDGVGIFGHRNKSRSAGYVGEGGWLGAAGRQSRGTGKTFKKRQKLAKTHMC